MGGKVRDSVCWNGTYINEFKSLVPMELARFPGRVFGNFVEAGACKRVRESSPSPHADRTVRESGIESRASIL